MGKAHLLSLGCPKNLVDSERLLRRMSEEGIHYSSSPEDSDIILVNTCGFIEDAKRESIEEILKAAALKNKGRRKKLVVFGCLAKRSGEELRREIPEIDAIWGVGDDDEILRFCSQQVKASPGPGCDRFVETPYAYLKVAEGCDRACSYCVIPGIRGPYKSRNPEEVLSEAEAMVRSGRKELVLVAQDITSYGKDLGGYPLSRLLGEMASIEGDFRIRLLYLYPAAIDDQLLETIAARDKVCNYIDMPLQHTESGILKLMGRGGSSGLFRKGIRRIRDIIPDVAIRTTFIVGFPQETEEDFQAMLEFIEEMQFDRLGAFTYSREEGSSAFRLKGHVPKRMKEARRDRVMEKQAVISLRRNQALLGKTFKALVDEVDDVGIARLYSQAPEIDGVVFIEAGNIVKGEFVNVRITGAYDYDLKGIVEK